MKTRIISLQLTTLANFYHEAVASSILKPVKLCNKWIQVDFLLGGCRFLFVSLFLVSFFELIFTRTSD